MTAFANKDDVIQQLRTENAARIKELEAEVVEYGEGILALTSTVKYLCGIAEKGKGHPIPEGVSIEHFVLGYVKHLESKTADLTEKLRVAKTALEAYPTEGEVFLE